MDWAYKHTQIPRMGPTNRCEIHHYYVPMGVLLKPERDKDGLERFPQVEVRVARRKA